MRIFIEVREGERWSQVAKEVDRGMDVRKEIEGLIGTMENQMKIDFK